MKGKKLISVFACSFLLLGGGTLLAVQSASKGEVRQVRADVEPNSTLEGVYSATDFNNTEFSTGYNNVLITYSGTAHGLSDSSIQTSEVLDKITLSSASVWGIIPWAGQKWFKVIYPNTVAAGDVLEIQAGLTIGDAVFKNTLKLKLNDSLKWERYYDTADLGTIAFTGVLSTSSDSAIYFYSLQTNAISTGWSAMNYVSGTITLNSTDISSGAKFQKANVHDYYFPIGSSAKLNDVLTIEAEFQGLDDDVIYHFGVQKLQVKWDGSAWNFVGQDVGTVEFESVHGASNNANLYLRGKETYDVFPQAWSPELYCSYYPVNGSGYVTLNGVELNNVRLRKVPEIEFGYYWYLELNTDTSKDDVVKIGGDWAGCGFAFAITEFARQWSGYTWGLVDANLGEIEFTQALPDSSATAIYFYTEATNDIPYRTEWLHINPDSAEQVLFNGNDITEGHTLQKSNEHDYYFGLRSGRTAVAGDVLEISGAWTIDLGDYSYHFTVKEFALKYNGTVWQSLAQYKAAAKTKLDSYLSEDDYLPADWDRVEEIIVNGKDSIDVSETFAEVDTQVEGFKHILDEVETKTERAQAAAAEVDALIDAIPDLRRTNYDEDAHLVPEARAAYNALSEDAKGYVSNLNLLQGAESRLAELDAAIAVDQQIVNIGTVTLEKEQQIINARTAYNALSANENRWVLYLSTLEAAEARLAELKTQKQHVEEVEALIDAIGNVDSTKATKDRIDAAYNAYQALTHEEKAMVSNKATLDSALANFDNAVGISRQNALDDVEEYYYGINMKKYSQENQDRINQLYADVQETIQAQEYSDNLAQIVNEFKTAVEAIPQKKAPAKKGCGGSIVATSVVLSALALAGLGLLSIKKRKED